MPVYVNVVTAAVLMSITRILLVPAPSATRILPLVIKPKLWTLTNRAMEPVPAAHARQRCHGERGGHGADTAVGVRADVDGARQARRTLSVDGNAPRVREPLNLAIVP